MKREKQKRPAIIFNVNFPWISHFFLSHSTRVRWKEIPLGQKKLSYFISGKFVLCYTVHSSASLFSQSKLICLENERKRASEIVMKTKTHKRAFVIKFHWHWTILEDCLESDHFSAKNELQDILIANEITAKHKRAMHEAITAYCLFLMMFFFLKLHHSLLKLIIQDMKLPSFGWFKHVEGFERTK